MCTAVCRLQQHSNRTSAERIGCETKTVYQSRIRAGTILYQQPHNSIVIRFTTSPKANNDGRLNGRQWCSGLAAVGRTNSLARCGIARAETSQGHKDQHAIHKEQRMAAAKVLMLQHSPQ